MTAAAPIERDTQLPSERRENSSTTPRMRIGPERRVVALTKSYDQVWLRASAGRLREEFSALPWPACRSACDAAGGGLPDAKDARCACGSPSSPAGAAA